MNASETIVAVLTPPGRGALATIGIRGPQARQIAESCLDRPVESFAADQSVRPWLRRFQSLDAAAEELVLSFPSTNEARLHCHGGPAACEAVLLALETRGARRVNWQDFAGPARIALASALTEPAAVVLLDQLQGAWNAELTAIMSLLDEAATEPAAAERIATLLARAPFGSHLTEPWKVVIAGRPNAGKSSLLNALLGYQRAITSPQPGTTRDVVTARTALAGWPVEFRDTAGLRESIDPLESTGVERAQTEIRSADLVICLIPADESATDVAAQLTELPAWQRRCLIVRSKSDLVRDFLPLQNELSVSAATGAGIDALCAAIIQQLVGDLPSAGTAVPWLPQQIQLLRQVQQRISAATVEREQPCSAFLSLALLPADN